jgi:thymidylate synthase ThyX
MVTCPSSHHTKRITAHVITDRAIANECIRHRQMSFCQQSQRYVKYDEMKFTIPVWSKIQPGCYASVYDFGKYEKDLTPLDKQLLQHAYYTENAYRAMKDYPPQQVRKLLPNMTTTVLVMTAYVDYFEDVFFPQRLFGSTGAPDPDMQYVAEMMWDRFNFDDFLE